MSRVFSQRGWFSLTSAGITIDSIFSESFCPRRLHDLLCTVKDLHFSDVCQVFP